MLISTDFFKMKEGVERLIERFECHHTLTEDEKNELRKGATIESFLKGDMVLREGEISKAFYFVLSGCVRLYYVTEGEDKTAFFYTKEDFVTAFESYKYQKPTNQNFECLEDTKLVCIPRVVAKDILTRFPKFEFLARFMIEEELIMYHDMVSSFVALSPEQRYLKLLEKSIELFQIIPQRQIATYLGIKPESLSRIKKRIAEKERS